MKPVDLIQVNLLVLSILSYLFADKTEELKQIDKFLCEYLGQLIEDESQETIIRHHTSLLLTCSMDYIFTTLGSED